MEDSIYFYVSKSLNEHCLGVFLAVLAFFGHRAASHVNFSRVFTFHGCWDESRLINCFNMSEVVSTRAQCHWTFECWFSNLSSLSDTPAFCFTTMRADISPREWRIKSQGHSMIWWSHVEVSKNHSNSTLCKTLMNNLARIRSFSSIFSVCN